MGTAVGDGWAPGLAGTVQRWVSSDQHAVHVWSDGTLQRSVERATQLGLPPRVMADGSVRAGRWEIAADSDDARELIPLESVQKAYDPAGNVQQLVAGMVAWTADGQYALIAAEYKPTRMLGESDLVMPGKMLALADASTADLRVLDKGPFLSSGPVAADRWVVAGGPALRVFDPATGDAVGVRDTGHVGAVATLGDVVVAGSPNGTVHRGDAGDAASGEQWQRHGACVESVALSPDGTRVASGDWNGDLQVWTLDGSQQLLQRTVDGRVDGACFLADDHLVVAVGGSNRALLHIQLP